MRPPLWLSHEFLGIGVHCFQGSWVGLHSEADSSTMPPDSFFLVPRFRIVVVISSKVLFDGLQNLIPFTSNCAFPFASFVFRLATSNSLGGLYASADVIRASRSAGPRSSVSGPSACDQRRSARSVRDYGSFYQFATRNGDRKLGLARGAGWGPRPVDTDKRRAAVEQLLIVAASIYRAVLHRHSLARLRGNGLCDCS